MADQDIALVAHLMRRAGFGASRDEIEAKAAQGYENVVHDLLNPTGGIDDDILMRYTRPITNRAPSKSTPSSGCTR